MKTRWYNIMKDKRIILAWHGGPMDVALHAVVWRNQGSPRALAQALAYAQLLEQRHEADPANYPAFAHRVYTASRKATRHETSPKAIVLGPHAELA